VHTDLLIYLVHALFWGAFVLTRLVLQRQAQTVDMQRTGPVADQPRTAPWSRMLMALHMLAFGVLYFGIGSAVLPDRVPDLFPGQRVAGTLLIAAGAGLMCWALAWFGSWRFRAQVDAGHQLATGGPFRLVRHPLYAGMNLLAIGTAVWIPTPVLGAALLLMLLGSDLRARAEEKLLASVFGNRYLEYCSHTRRFVPGIY